MRRLLLILLVALPVYARTLHWSSFDVQARVDRDGALQVVERQTIVFDGDWNGGERIFDIRGKQALRINRIARVEEGREIPLTEGGLSNVDEWAYAGRDTIRWRSRLPSDPPFANRAITYLIDYTLSNVLQPGGERSEFLLDHDFGMPRRDGVIERYTRRLEADPIWTAAPVTIERTNVAPGVSEHVDHKLIYRGTGDPAGVHRPPPFWIGWPVLLLFLGALALLVRRFLAAERSVGRFASLQPRFDESVLALPAEVAGAAWDAGIGAHEVAAILARMTQEGKLKTRTEGDTLHMTLKASRDSLLGYERLLVDKLFYNDRKNTDTDSIRKHYASSGFNPASIINHLLEEKLSALPDWMIKQKRYSGWIDVGLLAIAGFFVLVVALLTEGQGAAALMGGAGAAAMFGLFACIVAFFYSRVITTPAAALTAPFIVMGLGLGPFVVSCLAAGAGDINIAVLIALGFWCLAVVKLMLDVLKSRDTPAKIAFRKRIAGTRQFFIEELRKPQPALRDEWFPYVLGFGLGTHVNQWFSAFGGATAGGLSSSTWSSSSSSSSSASGSSWTGGGGAFGGAGASGTWAVAAGVMAAGVSAPSSSGSSSGGGGGSSSSGGGGGGGW